MRNFIDHETTAQNKYFSDRNTRIVLSLFIFIMRYFTDH
jgi:hypothetical protein